MSLLRTSSILQIIKVACSLEDGEDVEYIKKHLPAEVSLDSIIEEYKKERDELRRGGDLGVPILTDVQAKVETIQQGFRKKKIANISFRFDDDSCFELLCSRPQLMQFAESVREAENEARQTLKRLRP